MPFASSATRFAAAALLCSAGLLAGATQAETLTIGAIGPLTGPAANSGISMRQAYEAAAAEANKNGGVQVGGKKMDVKLIFEDSASRPEMGVSAAQKLLTRDNVDILVGDMIASSVTLAVMEVAPSFGKFVMSGQPVSIEIAKKIQADPKRFANFWKSSFNSDAYAKTLHDTVMSLAADGSFKPSKKTIAFIVEDTDYGKSNVEYTVPLFTADGWKVAASETVPLGHSDFYPQLSKLRSNEPDVLVSIFTSVNSGIALVKQMKEQGVESLHMAVYYPIRPEFLKGAGSAADKLLWTPLMFDPVNNPKHKELSNQLQPLMGVPASGDHAQGYCQMTMLLKNVERAGSFEPNKLSEAFATTDHTCAVGKIVYDTAIHTPKVGAEFLPVPMAQIQKGESYVVWPSTAATAKFQKQN